MLPRRDDGGRPMAGPSMLALLPPGPFAIYEPAGQHLWDTWGRVSLHVHLDEYRVRAHDDRARAHDEAERVRVADVDDGPQASGGDDQPRKPYAMSDGVAQLDLTGPMSKQRQMSSGGTSTVELRRLVRQAANDPDVKAILMRVSSPGGEVAGTPDLAADVKRAADKKPLYAYIEDLGASAAYWVASQANAVYANPNALVGSIGTYMVIPDASGMADKAGVKVHVIRDGEHKGAGVMGAPVTDAHLAHFQETVHDLNAQFLAGVRQGRGLKLERGVAPANGQVYVGAKARAAGLVDGITSYDSVLSKLKSYKAA